MHFREVLIREARRNADVAAFIYGEQRQTFAQLKDRACKLANALAQRIPGKRQVAPLNESSAHDLVIIVR